MKISKFFNRLPFQTLAPPLALLFVFLLISGSGVALIYKRFNTLQAQVSATTAGTRSLLEISRLRGQTKELLLLFQLTRDEKFKHELAKIEIERDRESQILKNEVQKIEPNAVLLESFFAGSRETYGLRNRVIESIEKNEKQRAENIYLDYSALYNINSARLTDLHAFLRTHLRTAEIELRSLLNTMVALFAIMCLIGLVLSFGMIQFIRRRLLEPLSLLHGGLGAVAEGKLGSHIQSPKAPIEIREMVQDFNLMTDTLQRASIDVTAAREQAMHAASVKSEFLANMSHEIRTPLNVIVGLSELISERELEENLKHELDIMRNSSRLLLGIVNDILDYSRLESGQLSLNNEAFSIRKSIKSIEFMTRILAQEKGITLLTSIANDVPEFIIGDAQRFEQALINLVNNAIKFTDYGKVEIDAKFQRSQEKDELQISVTDTGVGIKEHKLNDLFSRFVQADSSITRKYGGTGLGLAIAKQIMTLFKGDIEVESKIGLGSRFTLRFPIQVAPMQNLPTKIVAPTEIEKAPAQLRSGLRILLVDDSVDNRFLVQSYLKSFNVQITEAQNGREAVEAFKKGSFDIVLMDVQMPILDGYQATQEIRQIETISQKQRTPVVALTAFALKSEAERSFASGCDSHVTKPVLKAKLIQVIQSFTAI